MAAPVSLWGDAWESTEPASSFSIFDAFASLRTSDARLDNVWLLRFVFMIASVRNFLQHIL
mgnify:FL=1